MKPETIERARKIDQEYFGTISLEQSVAVFESALDVMKEELTAVNVRRKAGHMLFALVSLAKNQKWDLNEMLHEAVIHIETRKLKKHYYEAHVTIEPVLDEDRLILLKQICSQPQFGFRVAKFLMNKRPKDTPERSQDDSFCTARSVSYSDLKTRTTNLVLALRTAGFTVWRGKTESTVFDSRYNHSILPIDRATLPEKERTPRPPAQIPLAKGEEQ